MRIAVTGSTGFIGGYMARGLSGAGHDLRLLVRPGREGAAPQLDGTTPELFTGDLSDPGSLKGFLDGCQLLIHLASAHDHLDDEEMRTVNIGGTEALQQNFGIPSADQQFDKARLIEYRHALAASRVFGSI